MSGTNTVNRDRLIADMKVVVADAEELLRATANQAGDKMTELRGKAQENLVKARASLAEAQGAMVDKAKEVGHVADEYVQTNPWRSVGIAAGVAFVVGLLISRR
ncbi:MAG: DUF883 family protein [Gammaproteobacteria bacterium]|nr:DUF883 family protein [Gammaproteobacteria bacterium]MBU1416042.1 DUF883 family protein [Gammaproteobacteria bacterium]